MSGAAQEKIFPDVTEGPLDFPFRFGAVRLAGAWLKAVMARQIEQRAIVDNEAIRVFADHSGLHAIVEDLARDAAERLEGRHVAAQDALHVLVQDKARPDEARMAQHDGKEPDDPFDAGLIEELDVEAGEVDLRLFAGRRLEADLEAFRARGPKFAQKVGDRSEPPAYPRSLIAHQRRRPVSVG